MGKNTVTGDREGSAILIRILAPLRTLIALTLLAAVATMPGGCSFFDGSSHTSSSVSVTVPIPSVLRPEKATVQSVIDSITLARIDFRVEKDGVLLSQTKSVTNSTEAVGASFENVEPGTWDVTVTARDSLGREVASGSSSVSVAAGSVATTTVTLEILSSQLTIEVRLPSNEGIQSGKATLLAWDGSHSGIEKIFAAAPDQTVTIQIYSVPVRRWILQVELYAGPRTTGAVLLRRHNTVNIFAGQPATVVVENFEAVE